MSCIIRLTALASATLIDPLPDILRETLPIKEPYHSMLGGIDSRIATNYSLMKVLKKVISNAATIPNHNLALPP